MGGEILEENIILIRWNFSDQDGDLVSFNIYYSINEFEWIPIALNIVNQSSFIWDVSNFSGEIQGLKIRIEAWDIYNGTNIDTSESSFTIKHESQIPFDYLIIIIVIIFGISSVSIPLTSVHIIRKRRKKARKERKAPLIDFIESQEGKSDIRAEVMLKNEEILKQISGKNLDEVIEILRSHNITTISENFWKKIESLNLEDDDKKAFVYYLLSLKPSERDDLLDEMIRRSKEI